MKCGHQATAARFFKRVGPPGANFATASQLPATRRIFATSREKAGKKALPASQTGANFRGSPNHEEP